MTARPGTQAVLSLPKDRLDELIARLNQGGHTLGPRVRHGSIEYGPIEKAADLPVGWISEQAPGRFELHQQDNGRVFDAIPGADSWRRYLFPARSPLFRVEPDEDGITINAQLEVDPPMTFFGVRPCELAAIAIQDRVFQRAGAGDPIYRRRREGLFIVAVDCHAPAATCFCSSMGTGPEAESGFDLALSELEESFVLRVGSPAGAELIDELNLAPADADELAAARAAVERARHAMSRQVASDGLPERLLANLDHSRWDQVASRCLNCTNCTLVCPTCFCWDVADETLWADGGSQRVRTWDSCFNPDHSYHAGGGATRPTVRSRYRQWLTHKFASWVGQFGVSGCVGCGRCITWCPAGIDVTEELAAITGRGGP